MIICFTDLTDRLYEDDLFHRSKRFPVVSCSTADLAGHPVYSARWSTDQTVHPLYSARWSTDQTGHPLYSARWSRYRTVLPVYNVSSFNK